MLKNILLILVITQLALPYILGNQIKVNAPSNPPNPRPSCSPDKCPPGQHCELEQVTCCCAPCFPIPTCIDNSIPGCRGARCPGSQICVLAMGTNNPICVDPEPDASP